MVATEFYLQLFYEIMQLFYELFLSKCNFFMR